MEEVWDVYDKDLNKIGKDCIRGKEILPEGEYHLVVNAIILNKENKILIAKRAEHRPNGLKWEFTGGSAKKGEDGIVGIRRELSEEIGLDVSQNQPKLYKTILSDKYHDIKQIWLFEREVNILNEIEFVDGETVEVKFVDVEEYKVMYENGELIKAIDFTPQDFKELIETR